MSCDRRCFKDEDAMDEYDCAYCLGRDDKKESTEKDRQHTATCKEWRKGGVMNNRFPSKRKDVFIEVFCVGLGTPPFICGADGYVTIDSLQEIEDMLIIEMDTDEYTTFEKGDGTYLFKATHEPADEGTSAYWELEEVAFEPLPSPDCGEDDRWSGPYK